MTIKKPYRKKMLSRAISSRPEVKFHPDSVPTTAGEKPVLSFTGHWIGSCERSLPRAQSDITAQPVSLQGWSDFAHGLSHTLPPLCL